MGVDFMTVLQSGLAQAFGPTALVLIIAAIGLNVQFGYAGLLNFGQAGFMAVGAFGLSATVVTFGQNFWVGVAVALLAPVLLALLLGVPTLRLRADYLAIATIAAAEILRLIFVSVELKDVFGGSNGLNGYRQPYVAANPFDSTLDLGIVRFRPNDLWSIVVGWSIVAILCLIVWLLARSPWGRVMKGIREDEDAVRSLGKNVYFYKMQAMMLGGVIGGIAGLFHALRQGSTVADDYTTIITFYAYVALLIGGAARVFGPVIGGLIFWFLIASLGNLFGQLTSGPGPNLPTWLLTNTESSLVRFVLTGIALMLLMIYRPQGIFGDRREIAIDAR